MGSRRTTWRALIGGGVAVVAAWVVLVATGVVDSPPSSTRRATEAANAAPKVGAETAQQDLPPLRALTVDAPLKLWIGGDSLAGSLGPSLGAMTAKTGIVAPQFDSRVSTGLTTPDFFDWPAHATREMDRLQPEAVVFIIDTNDANTMPALESTTSSAPQWHADYAQRVEEMMQIFIGAAHRRVYWVGAPVMKAKQLDANVRALNAVAAEVAARHPEVTYVDVNPRFTDDQGDYASSLPDADGKSVLLRASDGIHLTPAGGDRMADVVFGRIDAAWHVNRQAVAGHAQPVLETDGSSQVPGTRRSAGSTSGGTSSSGTSTGTSSSGYEPSGDTSPTTEPTTPSTEPPTTSSTEPTTTPSTSSTTTTTKPNGSG